MNINYENQQQQTLVGSFKTQYPDLPAPQPVPFHSTQTPNTQHPLPKQIVHKVVYGDTLQGLSLTYDVSISKIKQRNHIESDSIYYLKEVVIPDCRIEPTLTQAQEQYMKVEEFVMHMETGERSSKTARYYLEENAWDVKNAVAEYRRDLEWERKNKITSVPLAVMNPLQKLRPKNQ